MVDGMRTSNGSPDQRVLENGVFEGERIIERELYYEIRMIEVVPRVMNSGVEVSLPLFYLPWRAMRPATLHKLHTLLLCIHNDHSDTMRIYSY